MDRPVEVIDYRPLITYPYVTGCTFAHPGRCVHHGQMLGWGRVWVDRGHPFILKYVQQGFAHHLHSLLLGMGGIHMRVTALTSSVNPSSLQFDAPVPVVTTPNWTVLTCRGRR